MIRALASLALSGPMVYRRLLTGEPFDPGQVDDLVALVLGEPPPHTTTPLPP